MNRRVLYVMDPMERILVDADSTFVIQEALAERGHYNYHALPENLSVVNGEPVVRARKVTVSRPQGEHFSFSEPENLSLRDFDAIFMRKDPPFNMQYIYATYILELVEDDVLMINRPSSLRSCNEKLYSLHFPQWIPQTVVSSDSQVIREFGESVGGKAVIKPLDGAGGEGVFLLALGDPNWNAIVEQSTHHGKTPVVVQKYIPEITTDGDKRVILLDGEPIGAIRRVPPAGELRGNIHVGATCEPGELDARELAMCAELGEAFRNAGLWFVGIDVIGGYLTEINVTSPTGIQEVNTLDGVRLETQVADFLESKWR